MTPRREFLKLGILGAAAWLTPSPRLFSHTHGHGGSHGMVTPPYVPYRDPLPIPPVLKPRRKGTVDQYTLVMKPGTTRCHSQLPLTNILGYNGVYPGPVIRATKGRQVEITQINQLSGSPEHLPTVHLHGGLVAPEHDGHPNDGIASGMSRTYVYPNKQRACQLWYHDHTHGMTGENVYRGLAGFYFIDDPRERGLRLPRGKHEIPLLIQDRCISETGDFMYDLSPETLETGFLGDVILANGVIQPFLDVTTHKYRFRVLNGSNARSYRLALTNGQPLVQIGTDGGLLQRPRLRSEIEIAPSERVDVIIDFAALNVGSSILLQNKNGSGRLSTIMRFNVVKQERDSAVIPPFLAAWEELPEAAAVLTREFTLNRKSINDQLTWVINGQAYDAANPPLAKPKLDTIEKWKFINPTNHSHPMHVHLVQFQVIAIDGAPVDPSDYGWKDTVVIPPGGEVTVLSKFSDFLGKYVFHCHNLEHEDFAMMAEFEVVA